MSRAPLLAVLLVTGFFAYINGVRLAFVVVYAIALLVVVAAGWSWWAAGHVRLTRTTPPGPFVAGSRFEERLRIENRSALPLALVEVRDRSRLTGYEPGRAFSLRPHQVLAFSTEGTFRVRGRHQLGPTELRLADPFGLFPRTVRLPTMTPVLVYPRLHALTAPWSPGARTGRDAPRGTRPNDRPPSVAGIREHDPADGMSRIHWLESARRGRLISRLFDADEGADLLIALDCQAGVHAGEAPERSFEYAVSLAGSVAQLALRQGRTVELVANDRALSHLVPGRGTAHEVRLLEWLALASDDGRLGLGPLLARHLPGWRGRGPLVVVTGARDPGWVEAIAAHSRSGDRPLAIYVDPATFGGWRPPLRVPARWRLVVDLWLVHRGDDLDALGEGGSRAAG
ncbi:MAG TPA: DUF58 domain-containing protein [Candidatus Micrarchaeia archaeon]|nr:DUF58 domain-containing protein [Candidatus Micrarchaeia archaeon]